MGSANITPLQSVEIIQLIRNEYDDYYATHEKNESNNEEFKKNILSKYDTTFMKLSNDEQQEEDEKDDEKEEKMAKSTRHNNSTSPTKNSSAAAPTISVLNSLNVGKKSAQKYQTGSKSMEARPKVATRLRSFDEAPHASKSKKTNDRTPLESQNEIDSWDSVKAQPACLLCAMVFTSPDKLNTHTKYSTIHASNLKRLENAKFSAAAAAAASKSPSPRKSVIRQKNSEESSAPHRVLYTGSKFFWRTKHNIDFHIYHHANPSILEIIAYDSATQTELPRLYLDETLVSLSISQDEILSQMKKNKDAQTKYLNVLETAVVVGKNPTHKQQSQSGGSSGVGAVGDDDESKDQIDERNEISQSVVPTEELDLLFYDEEKRLLVASRLMSKLQYQKVIGSPLTTARAGGGGGGGGGVSTPSGTPHLTHYELSFIDSQLQAAILQEKPHNITPVMISRRRHSTQAEISESFRSLNTMQMELQEITAKAEKMSQLIRQSIELFTQHHFTSPSKYISPRTTSAAGNAGKASPGTVANMKKKEVRDRWRYAIHKVVLRNALDQTVEMLKAKERGREHNHDGNDNTSSSSSH